MLTRSYGSRTDERHDRDFPGEGVTSGNVKAPWVRQPRITPPDRTMVVAPLFVLRSGSLPQLAGWLARHKPAACPPVMGRLLADDGPRLPPAIASSAEVQPRAFVNRKLSHTSAGVIVWSGTQAVQLGLSTSQ